MCKIHSITCACAVHFWATVSKTVHPVLSVRCLTVLSVTLVYCGQTVGRIKMKLSTQVGLCPVHIVLGGDPATLPKRAQPPPIFSLYLLRPNGCIDQDVTWHGARPRLRRLCVRWGLGTPLPLPKKGTEPPIFAHPYCGQTAGCIKMPLGMEVGLNTGDFVLDGDWGPISLPQKGRSPTQFSTHVYCGQTAAWIKMPLGTKVGLGLRDIVFDVNPATPRKRAHPPPPNFSPCLLWPNGWMDEDAAIGTEVDLDPGHIVLDRVPAPAKGAPQPPLFDPCIVATVAHLSYC